MENTEFVGMLLLVGVPALIIIIKAVASGFKAMTEPIKELAEPIKSLELAIGNLIIRMDTLYIENAKQDRRMDEHGKQLDELTIQAALHKSYHTQHFEDTKDIYEKLEKKGRYNVGNN